MEGKMLSASILSDMEEIHREIENHFHEYTGPLEDVKVSSHVVREFKPYTNPKGHFAFEFIGQKYFLTLDVCFVSRKDWLAVEGIGTITLWKESKVKDEPEVVSTFDMLNSGTIPSMGITERRQQRMNSTFLNSILSAAALKERRKDTPSILKMVKD